MSANTQGMDEHGNTKLPVKAAAEGTLTPEKEAVVDSLTPNNLVKTSNLNGMNSHGDTVIPERAAEANFDRHVHGLHAPSSTD